MALVLHRDCPRLPLPSRGPIYILPHLVPLLPNQQAMVCDIWLRYCAIYITIGNGMYTSNSYFAILLSGHYKFKSACYCGRATITHTRMTRVKPFILVPLHTVICRYCLPVDGIRGMGKYFSWPCRKKIRSELYFFKNPSSYFIRCFIIPSVMVCRREIIIFKPAPKDWTRDPQKLLSLFLFFLFFFPFLHVSFCTCKSGVDTVYVFGLSPLWCTWTYPAELCYRT